VESDYLVNFRTEALAPWRNLPIERHDCPPTEGRWRISTLLWFPNALYQVHAVQGSTWSPNCIGRDLIVSFWFSSQVEDNGYDKVDGKWSHCRITYISLSMYPTLRPELMLEFFESRSCAISKLLTTNMDIPGICIQIRSPENEHDEYVRTTNNASTGRGKN
jgi:hypothetical protein